MLLERLALISLCACALGVAAEYSHGQESSKKTLACYYTEWSRYRNYTLPQHYAPKLCTHLIYAFAKIGPAPEFPILITEDESFAEFLGVRSKDPNINLVVSIGGAQQDAKDAYSSVSQTRESRAAFIQQLVAFLRGHQLQGVDINWEFPNEPRLSAAHSALVRELGEYLSSESSMHSIPKLLLLTGVSADRETIQNSYDIKTMAKYVDLVLVMTYDFHGAWNHLTDFNAPLFNRRSEPRHALVWNLVRSPRALSTVQGDVMQAWPLKFWAAQGMPRRKILVGVATYARGWALARPENHDVGAATRSASPATKGVGEPGLAAYFEICQMLRHGGVRYWEEEQKVPFLVFAHNTSACWFTYDDEKSLSYKAKFEEEQGFGGFFVWSLDFDDFRGDCGTKYPLISSLKSALSDISSMYH